MEKLFDFVLKVIEALKPKFYNKLTWLIVVGGLSLMSTPLWLGIVNNLFEAQFQISITDNSDTTWGFALCCLGLSYHLMSTGLHEVAVTIKSKARLEKEYSHDVQVFNELHELLDEPYLEKLIANIETNDAIYTEELNKLSHFTEVASSSGKQFISSQLKVATTELVQSLVEFRILVSQKFDEYPYDQCVDNYRMCLAPEVNPDRAGCMRDIQEYRLLINIMMEKTKNISTSYKVWRTAVKELLYV
ncbi:hypothetical protein [Salinivibrio sp. ML290]|uniref:hypothetical protein n=1 Tax=Salinivibrio sp. ML290 TaxID=1909468 RepID=UPI0009883AB1|nr:hypothetical protein [Salinivibrio sp. ML290]OOE73424.1 hypothetical protein BZG23_11985 [Salinivibrio sp. ML290]